MLFSVLIANYNSGEFFKECFKSIIVQSHTNWEVIIVDDGSKDGSFQMIKELTENDSRFKVFSNNKNYGCGYTKNRCAALAEGEIAGFLDADDMLAKEALELMISAHRKHPEVSVISSKYIIIDRESLKKSISSHGERIPVGESYLTFGKGALTHFTTFKLSAYRKTAAIDVKMKKAVDQDLYYKLEEVGEHLFLNNFLYYYRIHDSNISLDKNLSSAQCWHILAMLKAAKRRKAGSFKIPNLNSTAIRKLKKEYYHRRLSLAREDRKYLEQFIWILKIKIS